jgi:flavorubredoxin
MSSTDVTTLRPEMPTNPLPREIAPGVFWLSECYPIRYQGRWLHSYNAAYLVTGSERSAMVDTGITAIHEVVLEQVEELTSGERPEIEHVFVTHSEMSHCGGVGKVLKRYPKATVAGEISDMHLVYPGFEDRMQFIEPGARFDLGDTEIVVVESVFRDLVYSRWFFDTQRKVLFAADGFAYAHVHDAADCGRMAEEAEDLDLVAQMQRFAFAAFNWTRFVDVEPYIERLDALLEELGVEVIAPTHGLPIGDLPKTMPKVREGFRAMRDYTGPVDPG